MNKVNSVRHTDKTGFIPSLKTCLALYVFTVSLIQRIKAKTTVKLYLLPWYLYIYIYIQCKSVEDRLNIFFSPPTPNKKETKKNSP